MLQAFYAYFQSNNQEMAKGEKEMLHSMQRIYDLYLYLLQLFISLKRHSSIQIEESKRSTYLQQDPLVLNTTFADNSLIDIMEESATFKKLCENRKISWEGDVENDLVKKLFKQLYKTDLYKGILISKADDFDSQKDHLLKIFKEEICNFSLLHHFFDERSIYWQDDLDHVASMVIKTIKSISINRGFVPMNLWKDDEEDFARNLFRKAEGR